MARIIYASDYVSQRKLFDNASAKHTADGVASILITMLAENNINLANDALAAASADTHETQRLKHGRQAESFEQAAKLTVKALTKNVRAIVQNLKKFYVSDIQKLGAWGATVNGNRVVIPATPDDLKTLIDAIITKHASYVLPDVSPLAVFLQQNPTINLAQMSLDAQQAIDDNDAAAAERIQKESRKQQRDVLWNPVMAHLRKIGGFIVNTFVGKEKKAGDWGYTIDDSPRAPVKRATKVPLLSSKTSSGVVIGSTFENEGATVLHVYTGKSTTGTPIIVPAGEMLGMTKGFSTITVVNPDTLKAGKYTVLIHR